MLSELPLSEPIAIELRAAPRLQTPAIAALNFLESRAKAPSSPVGPHPPVPPVAQDHFTDEEGFAMIEQQVTDHPPLQVCHPGHRPRMYRAKGNCAVVYYVQCSPCGVRSPRLGTPEAAAESWAARDVMPLQFYTVVA